MQQKQLKPLAGISAISSATCNLNCSFCFLTKNKAYHNFNQVVRDAWNNGTYVENMYKTVCAFPADPKKIETIQLWGGETLLNIEDVTKNVKKIYEYFSGLKEWHISTNWAIDVNKFFDFVCEINKNAPTKQNIILQLSIDGPEGEMTETGHNVSWDVYYKNMEIFTNLMNNTRLKNISIEFTINATVNKDIYFRVFSTYEGMYEYVKKMYELTSFIESRCVSESLEIRSLGVFPGYAIPFEDSVEDGVKLANISRLWEQVRAQEFPDFWKFFGFYYGIGDINSDKGILNPNTECGELKGTITVNPDGSICECSGSYIDHDQFYKEELEKAGDIAELRAAKLRDFVYYNPSEMTPQDIEKHDWYIYNGYKNNSSTYMCYLMSLAEELALSGQISIKYLENKDLLFKHLGTLSGIISCTRNNIKDTGIPYFTTPSCLRRYLNGLIEYAYDIKMLDKKEGIEKIVYKNKGALNSGR